MIDDEEEKLIDRRHEKDEIRRELDRQVAEYLARGGKITRYKFGEMTQDINVQEVEFRTRMERSIKQRDSEEAKSRENLLTQIASGKPIDLFGEES